MKSSTTSKYRNKPTQRTMPGGELYTFDSKKEAERYDELKLLLRAGKIRNLKLQPQFTLQEAFVTPEGEHVRAIRYTADFSYEAPYETETTDDGFGGNRFTVWKPVIEDVKGYQTAKFKDDRKRMLALGIDVKVI